MRVCHLFLSCLAAALFLASCDERSPVQKASDEDTLILSNSAEPEALDPQIVSGVPANNIIRALFEGLTLEDPEKDGVARPGVATHWEANSDFTRWTFHLRSDARWSDGTRLTSADFLFSYERILHPDLGAKNASMLYFIRGAEAFNKKQSTSFSSVGVTAPDSHTLVITTRTPVPFLPELTKHPSWFPVPRHTILAHGGMTEKHTGWTDPGHIVSNGPFILDAWKFNYFISVKKNPRYWDADKVSLRAIRFLPVTNTYTEARMFFDKQLHGTYSLAPEMIEYAHTHSPAALHQEPYLGTFFIRCNVSRPGLTDPRVRRALSLSIDQQAIIRNITKGGQLPAYGFTPPIGNYQAPHAISFDPEKARRLLAEAGFPDGKGFPKISLLTADRDLSKRLSEAFQDMWKKHLGIHISIRQQEWKTHLDTRKKKDYDLLVSSWIGDYPDPVNFLELWIKDGGNNCTSWHSPSYETLLKNAETAPTPDKRLHLLSQAESILLDELPIIPVYYYTTNYLLHPSVKGWHPLILNNHPYKFIHLTQ